MCWNPTAVMLGRPFATYDHVACLFGHSREPLGALDAMLLLYFRAIQWLTLDVVARDFEGPGAILSSHWEPRFMAET